MDETYIKVNRSIESDVQANRLSVSSEVFRLGAFFILFVLHLAFYLYFPAKRATLYFSIFALCVILTDGLQLPVAKIHNVKYFFYNRTLVLDFLLLSTFFQLTAIYSLLNQKKGWKYWISMSLLILALVLNATTYRLGNTLTLFVFTSLFNLEITRIAYLAVRQKQKGAQIVLIGCIGFLVFWVITLLGFPLGYNAKPFISTYTYLHLSYMLAFLSVPIATSIYLGLDFAFTSASLQQKLSEVERLSTEKQQILASQKERTTQLKQSFEELKATQFQLIQSEKMAYLGELTAGIAHEIQNPLNFLNNFSETNVELIEEMKQEIDKGDIEQVKAIANDVRENELKIHHHGKRADAIVKGMLQHSRATTGKKEPTDINALADEYLRLSYHGLRAKDKDFNASFTTNFDKSIGKIVVAPQDIGRVLLNLYNNAFYSVNEKKKQLNGTFEPTVEVAAVLAILLKS
jgi:two-component system, NtrC family, sensor kinase